MSIAPASATVALNQSLPFSASVIGAPLLTIVATNGAVRTSNVVTITTTAAHGFSTGQSVTISGVSDATFNGTFSISSVPSSTTFNYSQTAADATSGGGSVTNNAVTWSVNNVPGGNSMVGTITTTGVYTAPAVILPAVTATIAANGAKRATNVVTITTTSAHSFVVNQRVLISGVPDLPSMTATITSNGAARSSNTVTITTAAAHNFLAGEIVTITGVTDTSFDGVFTIATVPSPTTFTFGQGGSNATSGGGTATSSVSSFNGAFTIATVPSTTTFTYNQGGPNTTSSGGTVSSSSVQVKAVSVAASSASATAVVSLDSGITLSLSPTAATLAPREMVQFTASNSGSTSTTFSWLVNDILGGNSTVGMISTAGVYQAPAMVPAPSTVTVKAQAVADPSKTVTAAVMITALVTPTLTSLSPTVVAQGSGFQDFYIVGTNFLTTTVVRVNGTVVPNTPTAVTPTLLRVRVPDSFFSAAGTFPVDVAAQSGAASAPINLTVTPQRPALIGTAPDSATQGSPTVTAQFNGGYYSPSVTAEFNGGVRAANITSAQRLDVTLGAADLLTPGLFSVDVRNPAAAQPLAAVNLAVQPTASPVVVAASVPTGGTMPSSVAINPATGITVVANRGSGTVTRIDLATNTVVGAPIAVGGSPTSSPAGLAVDFVRNLAVVANNGSNNISIVDLNLGAVTATIPSPTPAGASAPLKPASVGVNPLSGLALVANASTNMATIIDLNTNSVLATAANVSTGATPEVAVEPRLNWAVITPGGAGTLTIVDLGRQSVITASGAARSSNLVTITTAQPHGITAGEMVTISNVNDPTFNGTFSIASIPSTTSFTFSQTAPNATSGGGTVVHPGFLASFTVGLTVRGISINPETSTAFLADPGGPATSVLVLSLLDQTVTSAQIGSGFGATAVNPLTNAGVAANFAANTIQLVDLRQPALLGSTLPVGTGPRAVAIDAGTNTAVVANETSNDVTIVDLGAIRTPHIVQTSPLATFAGGSNLTLNVAGFGLAGATVRLDGTPVTTNVVSSRQLTATIPGAMLTSARRYIVDVQTANGVSNVSDLTVIQAVAVGTTPAAVAIDPQRDLAVVTNSGSNNISVVNLNTGAVSSTIAVGTSPQGVAVIPRLGRAVVTNFGSSNASLVDLVGGTVTSTQTVGAAPLGVAIDPDSALAVVANSASNTASIFPSDVGGTASTVPLDQRPTAIAIDPVRGRAAITHTTTNSVVLVNVVAGTTAARVVGFQVPSGVAYDPVRDKFVVASSLQNNLTLVDPVTFTTQAVRVGINPTSLAYNRHSSTLVTTNNASNTMSVMDFTGLRVRAVLSVMASPLFAVDIHPRTNVAVVVDQANNRVLLVPLPR